MAVTLASAPVHDVITDRSAAIDQIIAYEDEYMRLQKNYQVSLAQVTYLLAIQTILKGPQEEIVPKLKRYRMEHFLTMKAQEENFPLDHPRQYDRSALDQMSNEELTGAHGRAAATFPNFELLLGPFVTEYGGTAIGLRQKNNELIGRLDSGLAYEVREIYDQILRGDMPTADLLALVRQSNKDLL